MHIPLAVARGREQLEHELLHDLRRQPGCAEADGDFRRRQIGGLDTLQGLHVDLIISGAELRALSGLPELLADVAGQVLVRRKIFRFGTVVFVQGIQEDDALQILRDLLLRLAGESRHVFHIHPCLFSQREGQRLGGGVHGGDDNVLLDRPLAEHIRLADKDALVVQNLQGRQQTGRAVVREGGAVGAAVEIAVGLHEVVIEVIQGRLLVPDGRIGVVLRLVLDQAADAVADGDHALDSVLGGEGHVHGVHDAVLAVVELSVHQSKAEIADAGVCRDGCVRFLVRDFFQVNRRVICVDVLHGGGQKIVEGLVRIGNAGGLGAEGTGDHLHLA